MKITFKSFSKKSLTFTQTCDKIISTKQRTTQQNVKARQTHIVVNLKVLLTITRKCDIVITTNKQALDRS